MALSHFSWLIEKEPRILTVEPFTWIRSVKNATQLTHVSLQLQLGASPELGWASQRPERQPPEWGPGRQLDPGQEEWRLDPGKDFQPREILRGWASPSSVGFSGVSLLPACRPGPSLDSARTPRAGEPSLGSRSRQLLGPGKLTREQGWVGLRTSLTTHCKCQETDLFHVARDDHSRSHFFLCENLLPSGQKEELSAVSRLKESPRVWAEPQLWGWRWGGDC